MIYKDTTVETHHWQRIIELSEPRLTKSRKGPEGKRYQFKAKFIVIRWQHGHEDERTVTVHGKGKAFGRKVEHRRSYDWNDLPEWIQEVLDKAGENG